MAEGTSEGAKKKTSPWLFVGIGCVVLIILASFGTALLGGFFAKKIGSGLLSGVIESKTGVKTNLEDLENGKMTFTDKETGTKVDIGSGKIPDNFPKDFPLYPGVKVTSAMSGAESGKGSGFWLTLSTTDDLAKVSAFYKSQLATNGWTTKATFTADETTTVSVTKDTWSGTVATTADKGSSETQIVIILGEDNDN